MDFLPPDTPLLRMLIALLIAGAGMGNVLVKSIVRLADGRRLRPPLRCPECHFHYPWWRRLPIVGSLQTPGRCRRCGQRLGNWMLVTELGTGLLFAALGVGVFYFECQSAFPEVRPSHVEMRFVYHLALLALLVLATGTDFRDYVIPDEITLTGMFIGVVGATVSADVQLIHLWVDWNDPLTTLRGPYIPEWFDRYRHWHGFAWSMTGLVVGGGLTWLVRGLSRLLMGREALGFGDVTLMAMIGSFVGWQPVVFVFMLAPLCGLVMGISLRLLTGRTYLPYGPYLAAATVVVLLSWKWLWMSTRVIFGDWPSLLILSLTALVAFVVLLGLLRIYRAIPVTRHARQPTSNAPEHEPREGAESGPSIQDGEGNVQ